MHVIAVSCTVATNYHVSSSADCGCNNVVASGAHASPQLAVDARKQVVDIAIKI